MSQTESSESIALKEKIKDASANIVAEIKLEIGELETEYSKARREQRVGILLLAGASVLLAIFESIIDNAFTFLLMGALIIYLLVVGLKLYSRNFRVIKLYHTKVDQIIFPQSFSILGVPGQVIDDSDNNISVPDYTFSLSDTNTWRINKFLRELNGESLPRTITAFEDLNLSELITEPHNTNQVDNVFEINYRNSTVRVAELDVKHVTGSGKNKHTKHIFHGYLVSFDLKRVLEGKTFVSAEKDKSGFGERSFFNLDVPGRLKETMLEWNEFEDLLHVATTNEVEARYILTPNFMHDLYDWWRGRETNIRLSFIKNRLCILYPDKKIRLNQTVEKITEETVSDYLYTIAWPLQNVIKLIDDVRL